MSLSLAPSTGPAVAPSGAAGLFISDVPAVAQARQLIHEGRLREAERTLQGVAAAGDPSTREASSEGLEIIRRLRHEYASSEGDLLARLHRSIPNVTADDLRRWAAAGQVQTRVLDGEVRYFRREPSNLLRFCPEAKQRRPGADKPATDSDGSKRVIYLQKVVEAAHRADGPMILPVRHRVTYRLTVSPDRPGAKAGSLVRCWLPFPQEYRQQGDVRMIRTDPTEHRIAPNAVNGSEVRPEAQRTVYLEKRIENPKEPLVFEEQFEYTCSAYYPKLRDEDARPCDPTRLSIYLQERLPHVAFTPELKAAVREAVGDETNPLRKVRKIYHFIDERVHYCAEEEYCIIPSFSQKAITSKKGDCGIQSALFITMCRAAGVPARWQSGWESEPWGLNMHDWSEFYVEPWGWLPADMSYGIQSSDDPAVREFYIGHLDAYRMIVNLDYGCPLVPAKRSLRSEPADFQRGEVELDGRNLYFDEWNYDMRFDYEP